MSRNLALRWTEKTDNHNEEEIGVKILVTGAGGMVGGRKFQWELQFKI